MDDKINRTYDEVRKIEDRLTRMEEKVREMEHKVSEIHFGVEAIRRTVSTFDIQLREIQKALALIYRNTDELEEGLLEEGQRKT